MGIEAMRGGRGRIASFNPKGRVKCLAENLWVDKFHGAGPLESGLLIFQTNPDAVSIP